MSFVTANKGYIIELASSLDSFQPLEGYVPVYFLIPVNMAHSIFLCFAIEKLSFDLFFALKVF